MAPQLGVCKLSLTTQLLALTHNWHHVDNGLYRSAQMYGMYVAPLLKQFGIKTIINLRGANPKSSWYEPERQICKNLGINHINSPLHSRRLPEKEALVTLLKAFETASFPILIKCSGGADRTTLASCLYLLKIYGKHGLEKANNQTRFWPYLHLPKRHQRWIKYFPQFFAESHDGTTFINWIESFYTEEAFAEWLKERHLGSTWRH